MKKRTFDAKIGKVEKDIPTFRTKYPFIEMELWDSFNVEAGSSTVQYISQSIRNCFKNLQIKTNQCKDWKISVKIIDEKNVRCWRIK